MVKLSDAQRKLLFAKLEHEKKAKEAQIAVTKKLQNWELNK